MQDGSISPLKGFFRNRWVRIILVIDVLALIIVIGMAIYNATKVSTIEFNIAPVDATISVNGNTNFSNGVHTITPGTYEIIISHEDLEPKTFTIDIAPRHAVAVTAFLSGPENDFKFYELKDNYVSFLKLAEIASAGNNVTIDQDTSAEKFIDNYQKEYNLWQEKLPIRLTEYEETDSGREVKRKVSIKVNYDDKCTKTLCIKAIMALTNDTEFVKQLIRDQGLNIDDYEVIYEIY